LSGFSLRSASFGTRPTRNCPLAERPSYYYVTLHRAEAVDDADNLRRVVEILEVLPEPVIFPVHPRTRKNLRRFGLLGVLRHSPHIRMLPPVNHRTSLWLIANASAVLTDSGGIQKEAYWAGVRCFTLRRVTEWGLLVDAGWNELVGFSKTKLRRAMASPFAPRRVADPVFARRDASTAIVRQLQADLR
jgi:UDP-N-acetylglucosamine 2-epimerase